MTRMAAPHITKIIGTGGIGTGVFYRLESNRDIGRDESRPAHRLDQRDYCKQHIILHYLAVLLRDLKMPVSVIPIGAVGDDDAGTDLLREMRKAGMRLEHVRRLPNAATLTAVCYLFPDGSGGNFTESQSACETVSPRIIRQAWASIRVGWEESMVLAAPEVPLESRAMLLELGRRAAAWNVASFVSQETTQLRREKLLRWVDLVSFNLDEAAALAGVSPRKPVETVVRACRDAAQNFNPDIQIIITAGSKGAFGFERQASLFLPRLKVEACNTAGAGDALLSGIMLGRALGLPFVDVKGRSGLHLGRALAAMKVLSPHTIHFGINLRSLRAFLQRQRQGKLARVLEEKSS